MYSLTHLLTHPFNHIIPQVLAVAVSVTGVVMVAVFSNSCSADQSTDHNSTTNASSPSPSSWGPQPLLGHIHRGGSCTEKSTFPGYLVRCRVSVCLSDLFVSSLSLSLSLLPTPNNIHTLSCTTLFRGSDCAGKAACYRLFTLKLIKLFMHQIVFLGILEFFHSLGKYLHLHKQSIFPLHLPGHGTIYYI